MAKNLVIVESPAKAKTIEKFLGSDFEVRASMGHIIDLPRKGLGVKVSEDFAPEYEVIENKEKLLSELRSASRKADTVYLAPDPDREGEFIAWALQHTLNLKNPRRAVFHEITKRAVQEAIANTRTIDENLFNAQQARRVLDRLVGYKISPLLWRRVQSGTSAGRVQSVALRLICDREAEIRAFTPEEYWTIVAQLSQHGQQQTFLATLIGLQGGKEAAENEADEDESTANGTKGAKGEPGQQAETRKGKIKVENEAQAQEILRALEGAQYTVLGVRQRDMRRQPSLPYTTSTLQQDASSRLHFKPKRTMSVAQALYEGVELGDAGHQGLITYMRTDSTRIAPEAQAAVKDYVRGRFGADYVGEGRAGKAKANVQDAHEAIRPTDVTLTPERVKAYLSSEQQKLYELIWRRFVASFMTPAVFDTLRVDIGAANYLFRVSGSTLKFAGFYAVWPREEDAAMLPPLREGEALDLRKLTPEQHFTQAPPRFSEATLIKELEERGIGRPSTYVPTVSTIQDRGYVEQQDRRFIPTWLGETINELMQKHFPDIVDVNFTADMERKLDAVEEGKAVWTGFLKDFYGAFDEELTRATSEMGRVQKPVEETDELCPQCGKNLVIRTGRFGKFVACSGFPDCDYKKPFLVKTGALCPQCGGDLVERKGRKTGKAFYGCANYPTCNFALWEKPLALPCPECAGLLTVSGGKGEPTATCTNCGAQLQGFNEGTPEVIGHRDPEEVRNRVLARGRSSENGEGEDGAKPTRTRRTTTRTSSRTTKSAATKSAAAKKTTGTTARKSATASGTKTTGTKTTRATTTRKSATASGTETATGATGATGTARKTAAKSPTAKKATGTAATKTGTTRKTATRAVASAASDSGEAGTGARRSAAGALGGEPESAAS